MQKVIRDFGLHMLSTSAITTTSLIRNIYKGSEMHSNHVRRLDELKVLDKVGEEILVFELSGELKFALSEIITSKISENADNIRYLIVNLKHVCFIDQSASSLLMHLVKSLHFKGIEIIFFGEWAMIDHGKRSATITADSDVTSMELKFYDLENEGSELSKNVMIKLTRNISKMLSDKLRRTNDVIKNLL